MQYEKVNWLIQNDAAVRLLRADNAPLIISFLHEQFKEQNQIHYTESELAARLDDYLYRLNQQDERYTATAKKYLDDWTKYKFLRKYYAQGDDAIFELTPATENALKWLEELNKQEFIGTESRLLQLFNLLKSISLNTGSDALLRIGEWEREKAILQDKIDKARQGIIENFSDTKIKEYFSLAEETARRLMADFRQVEENFRELDQEVRTKIIQSAVAKGRLLDDIFEKQDYIAASDQGKSFRAFWELLMNRQKQDELESMIEQVLSLQQIQQLSETAILPRVKNNLIMAGEKVNRTNDSLMAQLRKYLEQKGLNESRKILQSIGAIEQLLLQHKDVLQNKTSWLEIPGEVKPWLLMERPLYSAKEKIAFRLQGLTGGNAVIDATALYQQFYIDTAALRAVIAGALRHQSQVSLAQLLRQFPVQQGVAEVIAYLQIAAGNNKNIIDYSTSDTIDITNRDTGKIFSITIPAVLFCK